MPRAPILPRDSNTLDSLAGDMRGDDARMKTMTETTLQHVMADPAVERTLTMVADMVGLTKDMATRIVESGLPMMANVANAEPWVFKAMYAQSVKYLPEPTPAFYATLGKNATARKALAADFQLIYGPKTETINRDT